MVRATTETEISWPITSCPRVRATFVIRSRASAFSSATITRRRIVRAASRNGWCSFPMGSYNTIGAVHAQAHALSFPRPRAGRRGLFLSTSWPKFEAYRISYGSRGSENRGYAGLRGVQAAELPDQQ